MEYKIQAKGIKEEEVGDKSPNLQMRVNSEASISKVFLIF